MVATEVLFDAGLAHWAHRHILFVFFSPADQLGTQDSLACCILVPQLFAGEADKGGTLGALKLLTGLVISSHVLIAARLRTVPNKWVLV